MSSDPHLVLTIADASHVGEARRLVSRLGAGLGLDDSDVGRVGLVVTEAAGNIVKHARHGQLLVRALRAGVDGPGIEVLALDKGPGMADVDRCMEDGHSTAGSPGTGLGAIARMSSSLDVYSAPAKGTALLIRVLRRGAPSADDEEPLWLGAVRVAAPGETDCGDEWAFSSNGEHALLMVADGLGHGTAAAAAAREATRVFAASDHLRADAILDAAHRALFTTRGAAISIAELDFARREVCYAALGNVAGAIVSRTSSRSMVGQNGTAGAETRKIRSFTYPWPPGSALLMHSDGLSSHVDVHAYPGLFTRHPSLVAGVLYRDHVRGRDDATVVFAREAGGLA